MAYVTSDILETAMPAGIREGEILAGKYRISSVIGSGGMGVVVAAHHLHLDEKVAIKVLHPNVVGVAEAVDRFVREARAVVKIKSEHVVRVTDVDRLPDGSLYMVMEYLEGLDLGEWVSERGALPIEQSVDFLLQACEALADAHALGIIHRDLKPGNLFCASRSDGQPLIKVLDFGISKALGSASMGVNPGITGINVMLGSPLYMSPEQMHTPRDVDARTDIWSLGIILYELLAGTVPFDGETVAEIWAQVNTHAPPPLARFRSEVPAALEAVILKCLQKRREDRFANVAELAMALAPFGPKSGRSSAERVSRVLYVAGLSDSAMTYPPSSRVPTLLRPLESTQVESKLSADTMSAFGYTSPGVRRKRVVTVAIISAAVVMAIALRLAFFSGGKQAASASPSASSQANTSALSLAPVANAALGAPKSPSAVASAIGEVDEKLGSVSPVESAGATVSAAPVAVAQVPVQQRVKGSKPVVASGQSSSAAASKGLLPSASGSHKTPATTPNLGGRL